MGFLRKLADRILEPLRNERGQVKLFPGFEGFPQEGNLTFSRGTTPTAAPGTGLDEIIALVQGSRPSAQKKEAGAGRARTSFGGPSFGPGGGLSLLDLLSTPTSPGTGLGPIGTFQRRSRQEQSQAFQQQLPQFLQSILSQLGFGGAGGGFGGPSRADLLDPRLADIEAQRQQGAGRIRQSAASGGRDVSGSVFQDALARLQGGATRERQRATGDVDTLLAEIGLGQQGLMQQLILGILGGLFQ